MNEEGEALTISAKTRAEIKRLFHAEHFTMNAIAVALAVHHDTVKDALDTKKFNVSRVKGPGLIDPYRPFIESALEKYPKLRSTRLKRMIADRGYKGSVETVRRAANEIRPKFVKAFMPLTMIEGEQAQVDWAHFGGMEVENTYRKLYCFVMILAFSRAIFAFFTFDLKMETFLRCHILAFRYLGGVARHLLYDNLKSVVLDRDGRDIRFHPTHLEFSGHYHFKAEACNPRAGWEKGRVERSIRYLRDAFFYGRQFKDIDDLNRQLIRWLDEEGNQRSWADDRSFTVSAKWQAEKSRLLALPEHDYPTEGMYTLSSGKMPFLRFDLNDYSIPYQYVGKPLTLLSAEREVRILDGTAEIARHQRSYGRQLRIRNDDHFTGLLDERRRAKRRSRQEQLCGDIPEMADLFLKIGELGLPMGAHTKKLGALFDEFGKAPLQEAVIEALAKDMPRVTVIAQILAERAQRFLESDIVPPILPNRAHIRDLTVGTPDLDEYDALSNGTAVSGVHTDDQR